MTRPTFEEDLTAWEQGHLSLAELTEHWGADRVRAVVSMQEFLDAAVREVKAPRSSWAQLQLLLPERNRSRRDKVVPFLRRPIVAGLAASVLGTALAWAAIEPIKDAFGAARNATSAEDEPPARAVDEIDDADASPEPTASTERSTKGEQGSKTNGRAADAREPARGAASVHGSGSTTGLAWGGFAVREDGGGTNGEPRDDATKDGARDPRDDGRDNDERRNEPREQPGGDPEGPKDDNDRPDPGDGDNGPGDDPNDGSDDDEPNDNDDGDKDDDEPDEPEPDNENDDDEATKPGKKPNDED